MADTPGMSDPMVRVSDNAVATTFDKGKPTIPAVDQEDTFPDNGETAGTHITGGGGVGVLVVVVVVVLVVVAVLRAVVDVVEAAVVVEPVIDKIGAVIGLVDGAGVGAGSSVPLPDGALLLKLLELKMPVETENPLPPGIKSWNIY